MNKKNLVIYYIAVIGAFVFTQAPFWVARKATAASYETTVTKRAPRAHATTARAHTKKAALCTTPPCGMAATKHAHKPYKAISSSVCTFDPERNMLMCQHGEGITLELPVTLKKFSGNPLDYVARLPKSKNALCGLPIAKKGEMVGKHDLQQCGLVIDEARLSEASIVMGEKLKTLKPKHIKTTVAQASAPSTNIITE